MCQVAQTLGSLGDVGVAGRDGAMRIVVIDVEQRHVYLEHAGQRYKARWYVVTTARSFYYSTVLFLFVFVVVICISFVYIS